MPLANLGMIGWAGRFPRVPVYAGLGAFLLLEFLYFDQVGARHHTWVYPRWNDQIQYLTEAYTVHLEARREGFLAGVVHAFTNPAAQGTLHDFWTLLVFTVAGPSRSAALAVNMLAFIAWQVALFAGVSHVTRRRAPAWGAIGLSLVVAGPWADAPGAIFDFRLDWMATCALGVTLAAGLHTDGFRRRGASVLFGAAMGMTLLTRFLTGTYLALICVFLLGWTLCGAERSRRTVHLTMAVVIAAALAGPVFWLNREWVWNYYFIGHFTGPESAIRNPGMGLQRSFTWVAETLQRDHLGPAFWVVAIGALILLLSTRLRKPPLVAFVASGAGADRLCPAPRAAWAFAAFFVVGPALILALHQQKSGVVLGNLAPGVIVSVVLCWHAASTPGRMETFVAGAAMLAGCALFVLRLTPSPHSRAFETDVRTVNRLADEVFDASKAAGLTSPAIAVDRVTDALDGQVLRVICYERRREWVPFVMTLPTGIGEADEALIMTRLADSDFTFLTRPDGPEIWPYDAQLRRLRPQTTAWCDTHRELHGEFMLFGTRMALYRRRAP